MSEAQFFQSGPSEENRLAELINRFREAETALQNYLGGQIDAVIDPLTAVPVLLRAAQEHLRESEARYRRLLSRTGVIVFELEPDGTTLYVNGAVVDVLGYTVEELLGRNWWEILLPGSQRHQMDDLYPQLRTGDVTQFELTVTTRAGTACLIEMSTVNRRDPDGAPNRVVALATDITERRQAEIELNANQAYLDHLSVERMSELTEANSTLQHLADLRQRLLAIEHAALVESERTNKMKLQFLATVAHELRQPLTLIKGYASTLLQPDVLWDDENRRAFIEVIDDEADKLTELIESLMDLSQVQAGTLRIQTQHCALTEVIGTAIAQLEAVAAHHQLIIDVSPELPLIVADVRRLAGVLVNLVGNAAKFSPRGTPIILSAVQHESVIHVDVSDEGSGIAIEHREKVFETFWQHDRQPESSSKGIGLGLAIARGIIDAHGGRIWVADAKTGTIISFEIPISSDPFPPDLTRA